MAGWLDRMTRLVGCISQLEPPKPFLVPNGLEISVKRALAPEQGNAKLFFVLETIFKMPNFEPSKGPSNWFFHNARTRRFNFAISSFIFSVVYISLKVHHLAAEEKMPFKLGLKVLWENVTFPHLIVQNIIIKTSRNEKKLNFVWQLV